MCIAEVSIPKCQEIEQKAVCEVRVKEMQMERRSG